VETLQLTALLMTLQLLIDLLSDLLVADRRQQR
jgi:hypothetical protein